MLPNGSNLSAKVTSPGRSTEIKEIPQGDNGVMPFILVDGIDTRSRHNLQVALAKVEKKRMKAVQKDCRTLPLLEYTRPAICSDPTNESEKATKDALDFEADLHMMCLNIPPEDESLNDTGGGTPIPYAASTENLHINKKRLEEIRQKLDIIRQSQGSETPLSSYDTQSTDETVFEPKLTRQSTFEVPCYNQLINPQQSLNNVKESLFSPPQLTQADTNNPDRNVTRTDSKNNLFKNKSYYEMHRAKSNETCESQSSTELPNIINQIGDLLLQLPNQQNEKKKLENTKAPLSYLVTISPTADVSVESLTTESKQNSQIQFPGNESLSLEHVTYSGSSMSLPRNPVITIFAPVSPNSRSNLQFQNTLQHDGSKFQTLCSNPMTNSIASSSEKHLDTYFGNNPQLRYGRSRTFMEIYRDLSTKIKKY